MNFLRNQTNLIELRHRLHKFPELSGTENGTAEQLALFFKPFNPDRIIPDIGGGSLAVIFQGSRSGPTILFRSELDAVPVQESNKVSYRSIKNGISHACGHDGHLAIMAGFGEFLAHDRPQTGRVVLFFQAEEETGTGALKAIEDPVFRELRPDYVFSLHNIPGFQVHNIIIRPGNFSSASTGMIIGLKGRASHAADPQSGINPARAVSRIISGLLDLPRIRDFSKNSVLITIVMIHLGRPAFGISPGEAEIMVTLRSYGDQIMPLLTEKAEKVVQENAGRERLKHKISYTEQFPAVVNNKTCTDIVISAARKNNLSVHLLKKPFPWSEDFSQFTSRFKGALFGLGAGVDHPALHHHDYDFPDEIIISGVQMFRNIYKIISKKNEGGHGQS